MDLVTVRLEKWKGIPLEWKRSWVQFSSAPPGDSKGSGVFKPEPFFLARLNIDSNADYLDEMKKN
jgi:hypothetical protein